MKSIILKSLISAILDAAVHGIIFLTLKNKYPNMEIILIVSGIIVLLIVIVGIILYDKIQRFSRAVIDNIYAQGNLNEGLLAKPENADVKKKYDEALDVIKKYRPYKKKELKDLFIFDPNNPHQDSIRT